MHASEMMTLYLNVFDDGTWSSSCFNCTNVHTSSSLRVLAWRKSGNLIFTLHGADAVGFGDPLIAVLPSFHDIK